MKTLLKYSLLVLVLALTSSTRAHADGWWWNPPPPDPPPPCNNVAPEVDPSLAIGGLTLLAGTLTVLRSRRRR